MSDSCSYYAFRSNVFTWRVREAAINFTTTSEKKQWAEMLEGALRGALE